MNDFLISGVASQTAGRDLSFGSSGKEELYFFVSWMANASETALLMNGVSLSGDRVIWLELGVEGSLDILMSEGEKVSVEERGEGGGEFISVIKFDMMGAMSEY